MTTIEWTDATWNPVTGCSKVSPGCAHCYAEVIAGRFWPQQYVHTVERGFISVKDYSGERMDGKLREFTDVMTHEDRLEQPLRWRKPRRVFVNSMSDLFHEDVPDAFIERVFSVMALAERHTFQVLTKRADRMRAWFAARPWPLPNVWLGVSVENQHFADERIPLLLQTPAAVRFISAEPLLGPVSLYPQWMPPTGYVSAFPRLDWVIVGGESGPGARPFDLAWARLIVSQCQAAGVPVFVKQLGAWPRTTEFPNDVTANGFPLTDRPAQAGDRLLLRNRKGGDPSEWPEDLRVREWPLNQADGRPIPAFTEGEK